MSASKFTPGPWRLRPGHDPEEDHEHVESLDGDPIALVNLGEYEHDAHLIAAAPDLYAALEKAEVAFMALARIEMAAGRKNSSANFDALVGTCRASLAKARGES